MQSSSETHPADQPTPHESAAAEEDDDEYAAGLTARQKTALGFVWFMSAMYAIMNDQESYDITRDFAHFALYHSKRRSKKTWLLVKIVKCLRQILSKARFVPCSVRQELTDRFNFISLLAAVAVPLVFGPVLCPLAHLVLSFCTCCCNKCLQQRSSAEQQQQADNSSVKQSVCLLQICHTSATPIFADHFVIFKNSQYLI